MSQTADYIPGTCNINTKEIASRRKAGHFGVGLFIILLIPLVLLDINRFTRLILFVPAFIAAIGYLQAKNSFCVAYGAAGEQNATDGSKSASKISDLAAIAKDKIRARQINLQAAGYAIIATAITLVIPQM